MYNQIQKTDSSESTNPDNSEDKQFFEALNILEIEASEIEILNSVDLCDFTNSSNVWGSQFSI